VRGTRCVVGFPDWNRTASSKPTAKCDGCPLRVCAVTRRRFPVGANPTRRPLQPEATLIRTLSKIRATPQCPFRSGADLRPPKSSSKWPCRAVAAPRRRDRQGLAPGIGRQPNDAMTLAGMQISVRTRVHIPIFALHRNVRLWDNPTAFDPDRFAADKVKARSRYAYLPFGSGPLQPSPAGTRQADAGLPPRARLLPCRPPVSPAAARARRAAMPALRCQDRQ
jgi:Cytochrome P450